METKSFSFHHPSFSDRDLKAMEKILEYSFQETLLLKKALHHPSAGGQYFESLEFLGDRALALGMSQCLLELFPQEKEGDIAKRFVGLTRRESLLEVASLWSLEKFLQQKGHIIAGSRVLADGCEALIGAVYWDAVVIQKNWFLFFSWLRGWWEKTPCWTNNMGQEKKRDPKSLLQEYLQSQGKEAPSYSLEGQEGPSHAPLFFIALHFPEVSFKAKGKTKTEGEQRAAQKALDFFQGSFSVTTRKTNKSFKKIDR